MMYPLLLSALIALTVVIERFVVLFFYYADDKLAVDEFSRNYRDGFSETGKAMLHSIKHAPIISVIRTGLRDDCATLSEVETGMQNQAEKWIPLLEKRLDILDTVITAAPLMGLLGTITGMMASFQVLSDKGVNEPNAITGGVAEALIATATGLIVALFCLVAYNFFNSRVKEIISAMEAAGADLLEAKQKQIRNRS